jgi:AraC-type DNA-binding domain-containing proteins
MNNSIAVQFNKVIGVKIEEIFGNYLVEIEPGSFCVFDKNTPSNGLHYHNNFYELCYVTGGTGEFVHNGEVIDLHEGDVFIANPEIDHEIRIHSANGSSYVDNLYLVFFRINIYSDTSNPSELYEEQIIKEFLLKHSIIGRSQNYLSAYLQFINHYVELNSRINYGVYQTIKSMTIECLSSLIDFHENQFKKPQPSVTIVDRAIRYIGENLHRRIHIREIASNAYTSERNLQHLFRKHMNKSITEYINSRKTSVAAGYLKMNFTVSDVSNLFGINDIAQFSRLFKKYYGVSPKQYQLQYSPSGMVSEASYKAGKQQYSDV